MKPGDMVLFPRSKGFMMMGKISWTRDNAVSIVWTEDGEVRAKRFEGENIRKIIILGSVKKSQCSWVQLTMGFIVFCVIVCIVFLLTEQVKPPTLPIYQGWRPALAGL